MVAETIRDNSGASEFSVTMQIKCIRCRTKMLLQVGLTLNVEFMTWQSARKIPLNNSGHHPIVRSRSPHYCLQ